MIEKVNNQWLEKINSSDLVVKVQKVEVDEMASFVGKKIYQRWLWHAIDHKTGTILAFVLGRREDRMFLKLKKLLKPFGISKFYTDNLKTYERHLSKEERKVSKYKMQKAVRPRRGFLAIANVHQDN